MKRMIRKFLEGRFGTGDPEMLEEFFDEYRNNMTEGVGDLKRLLEEGDAPSLVKKAHSLKGTALLIGDKDLSSALLNFEYTALNGTPEDCRKFLPDLEKGLALLQENREKRERE